MCAKKNLSGASITQLLEELATAEIGHLNHIRVLAGKIRVSEKQLGNKFSVDEKYFTEIIKLPPLPDNATEKAILETALEREKKTNQTYKLFLTFTDLSEDVVGLFEQLRDQEAEHVEIITRKLNAFL